MFQSLQSIFEWLWTSEATDTILKRLTPISTKSYRMKPNVITSSILNNNPAPVHCGNLLVILVAMLSQYCYIKNETHNCTSSHSSLLRHLRRFTRIQFSLQFSQTL